MGWHPGLAYRQLTGGDFTCTGLQVRATLEATAMVLHQNFVEEMSSPNAESKLNKAIASLDPTQLEAYKTIADWAQQRYDKRNVPDSVIDSGLQFLLLGTTGTGKTHTSKARIATVRHLFQDLHAVLTVAHSGVAAANLGSGSQTIDSIFHSNAEDAVNDLVGDKLDGLVNVLRAV